MITEETEQKTSEGLQFGKYSLYYSLLMPIIQSAKKAHRVSLRKRVFNERRKRTMKENVKEINSLISSSDKAGAEAKLSVTYKAIDKAAKRGIIKPNAADRKKSRLAKAIAKIEK